jgi:hypothetical protein
LEIIGGAFGITLILKIIPLNMNWFVDEQVEEEANDTQIIDELKMIKDSREGLFMLDRELAARAFVMPPGLNLFGVTATAAGA